MSFQRIVIQQTPRRAILTLLTLAIAALLALNPNTGQGQSFDDLPITITSTPANAYTYIPNQEREYDHYHFNVQEGQDVTYRIELKPPLPPTDATEVQYEVYCWCDYHAGFVSYTLGAGTGAPTTNTIANMHTNVFGTAPYATVFPLEVTMRGFRVHPTGWFNFRLTDASGYGLVGSHISFKFRWHDGTRYVYNQAEGRVVVNERDHPADETTHQYVTISKAADVMRGDNLTFNVDLLDQDGNSVTAAMDINIAINTRRSWSPSGVRVYAPLVHHRVTIPTGASSTAITVQTLADGPPFGVARIYVYAYLEDPAPGVKLQDLYQVSHDATGKIVDGTEFSINELVFTSTEGSDISVGFNVDGRTNVGAFVLRFRLLFNLLGPSPRVAQASAADFVDGHDQYECTINPTRQGRHVVNFPLLEDHTADDLEVFHVELSVASSPLNAYAHVYGTTSKWAYGVIRDKASGWKAQSKTPDCVVTASSSSVPSPQPLQSPISFSTNTITLAEGSSFSYDVTLNSDPGDQTVTVKPASLDKAVIKTPPALSFTSANWNQPQAVVVTAEADADSDDEQVGIGHIVEGVSGAPVGPVVLATVTEQPTVGLDLRQPTQRSFGDQPFFAYWIRLDRQPSSHVEIDLSPAADSVNVQLHTTSLSFTSENWDRYQIVVLKPLDSTAGSELKITHSATTHIINSGESVSATISGG